MNTEQRGGKGLGLPGIESPLPQDIGVGVLENLPYTGPFLLGRDAALGITRERATKAAFDLTLDSQADQFVLGNIDGIVEKTSREFLLEPNRYSQTLLKATTYKTVGDLGRSAWIKYLTDEHPVMKNNRSGITTETLSLSAATQVASGLLSQYDTKTSHYFDELADKVKERLLQHMMGLKSTHEAVPPLIAKIQEATGKERFMQRVARSLAATMVLQEQSAILDTLAGKKVKGVVGKEGKEDVLGMKVSPQVDNKKGTVSASLDAEATVARALNAILGQGGGGYDIFKANRENEKRADLTIGKALTTGDFDADPSLMAPAYRQGVVTTAAQEINSERHSSTKVQKIARTVAQIGKNIKTPEGATRVAAASMVLAPTVYLAADAFLHGKNVTHALSADTATQALPSLGHIDIQAGIQALQQAGIKVTEFTIPTIIKQLGVPATICLLTNACTQLSKQPPTPPKDIPIPPTILRQDNTPTATVTSTPEAKASPTPALVLKLDTILGARGGSGLIMDNIRSIDNNGSHGVSGFDIPPTFYSGIVAPTSEAVNVLNAYPDPQSLIGSDGNPMHITNLKDALGGDVLTYIQKDGTFVVTPLLYPKQWNGENVQVAFHFDSGNIPKVYFVTVNGEVVGSIDMPLLPVPPGKAVYFDPGVGKYMMATIKTDSSGNFLKNADGTYVFDPTSVTEVDSFLQVTPAHPTPTLKPSPTNTLVPSTPTLRPPDATRTPNPNIASEIYPSAGQIISGRITENGVGTVIKLVGDPWTSDEINTLNARMNWIQSNDPVLYQQLYANYALIEKGQYHIHPNRSDCQGITCTETWNGESLFMIPSLKALFQWGFDDIQNNAVFVNSGYHELGRALADRNALGYQKFQGIKGSTESKYNQFAIALGWLSVDAMEHRINNPGYNPTFDDLKGNQAHYAGLPLNTDLSYLYTDPGIQALGFFK